MPKKTLGRGLGAILGEVEEAYMRDLRGNGESVLDIEVERIRPNPFQPRKQFDQTKLEELAASIKRHGLIQPVLVVKDGDDYMLIAGERRLRASKLAGLETIRSVVGELSERQHREIALIENIQREELNPIELAHSFQELLEEYSITHEALAESVNKSRAYVTNTLRLLNLGEYAKGKLMGGKLTYGHAKVLVGLDSVTERKLVDSIVNQRLTVRDAESLVRGAKPAANGNGKKKPEGLELESIVRKLAGNGVKVTAAGKKVTISFDSQETADAYAQNLGI